ncbi:OB-fold protein [Sporosarcina sp. FA9]|uniref:OB-fold protein n=1 Tax=Sporosarcina sp. FA9 TaxID=3413030 RepID=UPI003F655B70
MSKTGKVKKPFYKKWWVWLIVIFIIGAVAVQGEDEAKDGEKIPVSAPEQEKADDKKPEEKKKEKEPEVEKPKEEAIVISAVDLYSAYDDNEIAADQKYKGKQLEVTGTIKDIGKDILDSMYITLDTGDVLGSIQVYFPKDDADSVAALSKGQDVTVIGKGDGFLLFTVSLKKSQVK